jgi:hypothetical protein
LNGHPPRIGSPYPFPDQSRSGGTRVTTV